MPSQTGSIDLTSQVAANNNAISVASDDATTKANNAAKTATNYITADSNGIKIHMTDNSTTYQHQSATGTNFYVNSLKRSEVGGEGLKVYVGNTAGSETEVGHFGEYTRIGDIESSHTTISPLPNAGVAMYDETGSTRALRVATSGLYIGSDDTAHFSDDGFTLFPQGSDVGDVVRLNAGSIGTQRTNITRTIKLEANETLSTLSLSGAPTISNIYRNTTALVKGTDYIQQTTTNSGGVDWEYNSTKDGHYINTNIIFNPAITGPASVIIECGVLVPQNYYMRMGPEWYNHTVIDDEGFRVINYNGDPVFNVDMASDGTSSVTVGESDKQHMVLDAAGLSAYDENGDYAEIKGIIDGENIKPNSVTANEINAENLKVSAANITGTLSADKINTNGLVVGIDQVTNLSSSMAWQGTCTTAAGTAAKAVTCAGFTLNSGATITVQFTTANTSAAALTLNVNSTGAKTIYVAGAATAAANQLLWAANATISFTYDGTYWRVTGEPRNWYGACTSVATTAAKTATINEVVLCKGSTINLQMTNANAVANPTLNITSLGAKDIYTANAKLTATSPNNWSVASTIPFVFDGQNFRYDSEASSKANNIEVGGRNLLKGTGSYTLWDPSSSSMASNFTATDEWIKFTTSENKSWLTVESHDAFIPIEDWDISSEYTLSVDIKYDNWKTYAIYPRVSLDTVTNKNVGYGSRVNEYAVAANPSTNDWTHFEHTFDGDYSKWSSPGSGTPAYVKVIIWLYVDSSEADAVYIRHLKLEKGNKATDWTLAPEDIAADISAAQTTANNATPKADAIKRTQRIYYRSNSATAPSTPGTVSSNWVTKSDDGTDVWTKMHVAISSTHKYVYTCEQYQFANETVGYTTVLRDNTITVIDGGNIITGSVAANSINASSGTFDEANIPNLNASKITAGDISADRIKTNVISAINSLTAGQINADRINASELTIGIDNISDLNDIQIGGKNLLLDTPISFDKTNYLVYKIPTTVALTDFKVGDKFTIQLWGVEVDANYSGICPYWNGGSIGLAPTSIKANSDGYWKYTVTVTQTMLDKTGSSGKELYIYNMVNGHANSSLEIARWKMEKGAIATDWTPAPEDVDSNISAVNTALQTYSTNTNTTLQSLQNQVDGQIEAWYKSVDPTTSNEPASAWNTDTLKQRHVGDLYYNVESGHSWRWMQSGNTYEWHQIPDSDAAAALELAQSAQNIANSKRRIFTTTPTVPYDIGDLWVNGSSVKYCTAAKTENQTYSESDWSVTATDDTAAQTAMNILNSQMGDTEYPYRQVEWIESNGRQFIYLDWKPLVETFGFEADFICRNAHTTTVGTWDAANNTSGFGNIFGTRNASNKNEFQLTSYSTTGALRCGTSTNLLQSGEFKTDHTRQQISLHGNTIIGANGVARTFSRTATTNTSLSYTNMSVFGLSGSLRNNAGTFGITQPGSIRIYSLKFYDGETLAVDLVPAIRNIDNVTGLYDKVSNHFYPAFGALYGNEVDINLGTPKTLRQSINSEIPTLTQLDTSPTRMITANAPMFTELVDGQQFNIMLMHTPVASVESERLAGWEKATTSYTYVHVKLYLANGRETDWIPAFYNPTTRLTDHYKGGVSIPFVYRENYWANASTPINGTAIARGLIAGINYYDAGSNYYDRRLHNNAILAKTAIVAGHLIVSDGTGYYHIEAGTTFNPAYTILYASAAIAATKTGANTYEALGSVNFANTGIIENGEANKMLYLRCLPNNGMLTVSSTPLDAEETPHPLYLTTTPSPVDSNGNTYIYIPLGIMVNATQGYFASSKDMYAFINNKFIQINPSTVIATQKLYYRTTSLTAPTAPTTWITTNNPATYNAWNLAVPPLATSKEANATKYPYLYSVEQHKRIDGTIITGEVSNDSNTTIIDGGSIITNSVTATQIAAGAITTDKLDANAVTADKIDVTNLKVTNENIDGTISFGKIANITSEIDSIVDGKGYATQAALNTEIAQRKAQYGTSSTAAATAAKVVACDGFKLVAGNELTVKFSTANTSSVKIQLNVNSEGAKDVWVNNVVTSATNQLLWGANAYITFRYDGTQFQTIGEPRTWYGTCGTAEATQAKAVSDISGCVICKGTKVELAMTYANSHTSPTLNVASTGAKNLYFGTGTSTRPIISNGTSWLAANTATFTFDGANWRTQGKTYIDANSIITGYLNADRIESSSITADKINTLGLSIGYSQLTDTPSIPAKVSELENDSNFTTTSQVNDSIELETTNLSDRLTDISADLYGTVTPDENGNLDESTRTSGIFAMASSVTDLSETVGGIGESITEFNTTLNNRIDDANANVTSIQEALYGTTDTDPIFATSEEVSTGYNSLNNSMTTLQNSLEKNISDSVEEVEAHLQNQYDKTQTDLEKLKGYVRVEIDSNQVPYLELGQVSDEVTAYKVTAHMTNSALDFKVSQEAEPVASIGSNNEGGLLKVTKANIGQLDIGENSTGHWEWQQRANGNLALKWIATQS